MRKTLKKGGFTLLEVLISIGIFGIAGLICLENYLINMKNAGILQETQTAVLLAENKVEEFKLKPEENISEENGVFSAPYENYKWEISFTDLVISETEQIECKIGFLNVIWQDGTIKFIVPILKKMNSER